MLKTSDSIDLLSYELTSDKLQTHCWCLNFEIYVDLNLDIGGQQVNNLVAQCI